MTLTLDSMHITQHTADFAMTTCPTIDPDLPTPDQIAALEREIAITGAHLAGVFTSARALLAALPGMTVPDCILAATARGNRLSLRLVASIADEHKAKREPAASAGPLPDPEPLRVTEPDRGRDLPAIAAHHGAGLARLEAKREANNARMLALLPALIEVAQAEIDIADETSALATEAVHLFPGVHDPQGRGMDALVSHLDTHNPALTIANALEFPHRRYLDALTALTQEPTS